MSTLISFAVRVLSVALRTILMVYRPQRANTLAPHLQGVISPADVRQRAQLGQQWDSWS